MDPLQYVHERLLAKRMKKKGKRSFTPTRTHNTHTARTHKMKCLPSNAQQNRIRTLRGSLFGEFNKILGTNKTFFCSNVKSLYNGKVRILNWNPVAYLTSDLLLVVLFFVLIDEIGPTEVLRKSACNTKNSTRTISLN